MKSITDNINFLKGGGEMGELTRLKDWSKTSLGSPHTWPDNLRTTLGIILHSKFPMFLWWGPELICFYNDAYRPSLGQLGKHPSILGMKAEEAWAEIWHIIKPLIDKIGPEKESTWSEDQLIPIYRNGKMEDVYWTFSYSPVNDEFNNLAGVLVICNETTDKVNTLKKIGESEQRFRTMAEGSDILIALSDETGNATYFNSEWVNLTGRPMEDLLKYGWADLIHAEDRDQYLNIYQTAFAKKMPFKGEFRVLNKTGQYSSLLAKGPPRFNAYKSFAGYVSSCVDITELRQADHALIESEKRFRLVAETLPQLIWETDQNGNVVYASGKWKEYTGVNPVGEDGWKDLLHPDDRNNTKNIWIESLRSGEIYKCDLRIKNNSGEYRWHTVIGNPIFDKQKQIIKWVGAFTNIHTEKIFTQELEKQVEARTIELEYANKKLEKKNDELNKMNKELISFAYLSSHDLQEPLRKIQTFVSQILKKEQANLSDDGKDKFQRVQNSANRMQQLLNDLLAYSRTNIVERKYEKTDLREIIEQVKKDLNEDLQRKNATIEINEMCEVNIIRLQFYQLMNNLIKNSLKFSNNHLQPCIKIIAETAKGKTFNNINLVTELSYCHISISDNGIGFEPEYNEKIFEVFQRLHGNGEYTGTGIGLAIVKKIVENHDGIISASGIPGIGATFDIYFPAT